MIISTTSLEAHWSFDNDSCHDFSGNGRDLSNLTNVAFADGISGKCLSFADRSVIRAAYGAAINFSAKTALSISWWCSKTAAATVNALVFCFALSSADGVYAYCPTGTSNITLRFNRAAGIEEVTVAAAFDATLRHYALTFDLATKAWILYRDGAPIGNGALVNTPVMPNRAFVLGNYNTPAAASGWIGLIDEVRLYSRVLTPTEALALYEDPGQNASGVYIEQALLAYLSSTTSSTAVAGAVNKRLYFAEADPNTPRPYIVLHTISDAHKPFAFGQANSGQPRIQVNVYSDDRFNAMEIAHKVRQKLRFYSGTMDGITIHSCEVGGTVLIREPNESVYQASVDVLPIYIDAD